VAVPHALLIPRETIRNSSSRSPSGLSAAPCVNLEELRRVDSVLLRRGGSPRRGVGSS
jgi:hypothetical protein